MTTNPKTVRVLVAGNVNGNIKQLCNRVNNVNKKNGPFHLLLVTGRVIGPNIESWTCLRDGTYHLDVPSYILGADTAEHVPFFEHLPNGEVCENVTYLGRRGVYTTTSGLSIAYLSGVKGGTSNSSSSHCYSESDLHILRAQSGVLNGVDILINNEWPSDATKHVKVGDVKIPQGVRDISDLANTIRPRYHFVAGPFYERLPYRNHKILHERAQYCTRFISVGTVANKEKEKWLYAFSITPMKHLNDSELRKQPVETSENPYIMLEKEKEIEEDRNTQHFYAIGEKRKTDQTKDGGDKKKDNSCWFCLKSPNVEKHLIVSIGTQMYIALAKGALRNDHVMIIPTSHIKCQQFLQSAQQTEADTFKTALCKMNRKLKKSTTVFFERSVSTSHMQIQCIPVPEHSINDIKDVFYTFAEKYSLEIQELPDDEDWKEVIPPSSDYFIAEFENKDKLIFICSQKIRFPLQFGREVLASEELLNIPRRVSWKECKQSTEQETYDSKKFREAFNDFNPFKDDSESD